MAQVVQASGRIAILFYKGELLGCTLDRIVKIKGREMNSVDRFTQVEATLALAGIELSVSEVQGTVVGAIANHLKTGLSPDLLKLIEPEADANDGRYSQLSELLYDLYRENSEILFESKEGYDLLLPDDDENISIRVDSLAGWCKGYLLGLLYNDRFSVDQIPESGAEIVRDMMEIAEAGAGADDEQEEDWALGELEEYIKVGSQLIFEFIFAERSSEAPKSEQ